MTHFGSKRMHKTFNPWFRHGILPRSLTPPFLVKPKPGDEGVEGADVIPLLCPRLEKEDRLFAEGDKEPFILPINDTGQYIWEWTNIHISFYSRVNVIDKFFY